MIILTVEDKEEATVTSVADTDGTQSYLVSLGEVYMAAREFVCSYQPSYLAVVTVSDSVSASHCRHVYLRGCLLRCSLISVKMLAPEVAFAVSNLQSAI